MNNEDQMNKKLVEELSSYTKGEIFELKTLLVELSESKYWDAIKWYSVLSQRQLQILLSGMDPVKDPTNMARNQGMMLGTRALEDFIVQEKNKRKDAENEKNEKNEGDQSSS